MGDIAIEVPDDLWADYQSRATELGISVEELMARALRTAVPRRRLHDDQCAASVADLSVVKAAEIEKKSRELSYNFGWRFITCPEAQRATAKLLLVSLNPAGREVHGPAWSQEEGSAYRVESWNGLPQGTSPLQRQVQALFAMLGLTDDQVFSAHYVPFRSPSWAELKHRDAAEQYARELWRWLLPRVQFERIICIGKDRPGKPLAALLGAKLEVSLPVGWGDIKADRYRLEDGRTLIALPHLSRFALFGRSAGERPLQDLLEL